MGLTHLFKRNIKDDLNGIKTIRVNGHKFKIKKINPFLDFESDRMPQIFSYYIRRKKVEDPEKLTDEQIKKSIEDMKRTVSIGVVEPKLCPEILTIDDIFRWGDTGAKLYLEIISHSLNQFRGIKGLFFSIKIRHLLFTQWQNAMASVPST